MVIGQMMAGDLVSLYLTKTYTISNPHDSMLKMIVFLLK